MFLHIVNVIPLLAIGRINKGALNDISLLFKLSSSIRIWTRRGPYHDWALAAWYHPVSLGPFSSIVCHYLFACLKSPSIGCWRDMSGAPISRVTQNLWWAASTINWISREYSIQSYFPVSLYLLICSFLAWHFPHYLSKKAIIASLTREAYYKL